MKNLIKTLQYLAQYEIDATFIIAQAISTLSDKETRDRLSELRQECENNIKIISDILMARGSEAPEHTRDFKGFFMQGYTGMRGLISDHGVMKALSTNTKMLVNAFEEALKEEMPDDVKEKIQQIFNNAKAHLDYFVKKSNEL